MPRESLYDSGMLLLEILEYGFEALLVWIGTPGGFLTALASLALGLWWLTRWLNMQAITVATDAPKSFFPGEAGCRTPIFGPI